MDTKKYLEEHCTAYRALKSGNVYVAKDDVFTFFEDVLRENCKQLGVDKFPELFRPLFNEIEKGLQGTCEFVLASEWHAAYRTYFSKQRTKKSVVSKSLKTLLLNLFKQQCYLVHSNEHVFLPYKDSNRPKIVRLFKDGKDSFAIIDELEHALHGTAYKTDPLANWDTVDFKTVLEMTKGQNVELLVTPIMRDEQNIVIPIRTPIGTLCKPAGDTLLANVMILVINAKAFEKADYKNRLSKFVARIREYFQVDKKERFFITQEKDLLLEDILDEEFKEKVETVTCHFRYIESCFARFMHMFPELMEFYHNHKVCEVMKIKSCRWCKEVENEERQTFEGEAMEMLEEVEKRACSEGHPEPPMEKDQTSFEQSLEQENQKTPSEKAISECCKAFLEAQRKEMDEMKLMVRMLQEEVQQMKLQSQEAADREAALVEKCRRTSKLCDERSAELETTKRKLKKCEESESMAQKKLKELEEKQKEKPTREELIEELEKFKKEKTAQVETLKRKVEEIEKEKIEQAQLHEAVEIRNSELTAEVQRLQLAADTATEEFAVRLSELETYNSDKEGFIRLLKGQLSPETLAEMDVRLPLEMSRLFHELLPQDGQLLVEHEEAYRKVTELTLLTPGNIELHRRADWWRIEYQEACTRYSTALVENIRRIRADHFITKAELVPQPDYPVLAEFITTELEQARERARDARNAQIDAECPICLEPEEGEWWWCPGCLKKFHQDCIDAAWADGEQRCPSCRRLCT